MDEKTEDRLFRYIWTNSPFGRKELSKEARKYFGEEGFKAVQDYWKKGFLYVNHYGYINVSWKGMKYWRRFS